MAVQKGTLKHALLANIRVDVMSEFMAKRFNATVLRKKCFFSFVRYSELCHTSKVIYEREIFLRF